MAMVARFASLCIVSTMTLLSTRFGLQPGEHVEAAQPRHGEVRDDHVGAKPLGRVDEQRRRRPPRRRRRSRCPRAVGPGLRWTIAWSSARRTVFRRIALGETDLTLPGFGAGASVGSSRARWPGPGRARAFPSSLPPSKLTVPPASLTRSRMLTSPSPLPRSSELRDIEPLAIVCDRHLRVVAGTEQPDLRPAGAGVRDDVAQRFLRDPVEAERDLRGDGREVPLCAARSGRVPCERSSSAQ